MRNIYLWIATAALNMLGILTIKLRNDMYFEEPTLENKRVVSGFRKESMAFSLTYCSAVCLRYDFCECFGFNPTIQACRIHASCRRNSTFVNNAGWKYYKRGMCIRLYLFSVFPYILIHLLLIKLYISKNELKVDNFLSFFD